MSKIPIIELLLRVSALTHALTSPTEVAHIFSFVLVFSFVLAFLSH